jgi:hypothetical protein
MAAFAFLEWVLGILVGFDHPAGVSQTLRKHIATQFRRHEVEEFVWAHGPIRDSLPNFVVYRVAPRRFPGVWHYVSNGAWEVPTEGGDRLEFMIVSPVKDPIHVETLAMVANLHADDRYRRTEGMTINIGRGWMDGSECDHFLIALPYLQGPAFEHCHVGKDLVRILWLLPITASEAEFAKRYGVESLEQRFEHRKIDVVDVARKSVV